MAMIKYSVYQTLPIRRTDNTTTHKKGDEDNDQQNAAHKID
jgi:hypothetical protein